MVNVRHSEPLRKMDLLTYFLTYLLTLHDDNVGFSFYKAETTKIKGKKKKM